MKLNICEVCKRPFLADKGECPSCPGPYDPDTLIGVGCLVAMVLPIVLIVLGWFFFFFTFVFR